MRINEDGSSKSGCSDTKYCQDGKPKPEEQLQRMRNDGLPCLSCHGPNKTTPVGGVYSDWFSGAHGGCFMCHAAVANGQTMLANSQMATSYGNATTAQGYGALVIIGSGAAAIIIGYFLPTATAGTTACSAYSACYTAVEDMFEGAKSISDDAYVAIQPAGADASIITNGLSPAEAGSDYVWVTQMRYVRSVDLASAADNLMVDAAKWTSQPLTLWELKETAQSLQPYFGAGLGNVPQWASSSPLINLIQHSQLP